MKCNYLKKFSMKKLVYSFVIIGAFVVMTLGLSACDDSSDSGNYCHNNGWLDCGKGNGCCRKAYPYSGGNSCWATMNGCRSSGYACNVCW